MLKGVDGKIQLTFFLFLFETFSEKKSLNFHQEQNDIQSCVIFLEILQKQIYFSCNCSLAVFDSYRWDPQSALGHDILTIINHSSLFLLGQHSREIRVTKV